MPKIARKADTFLYGRWSFSIEVVLGKRFWSSYGFESVTEAQEYWRQQIPTDWKTTCSSATIKGMMKPGKQAEWVKSSTILKS